MDLTNEAYLQYVKEKEKAHSSPLAKNTAMAFLVGGLICMLGQALSAAFGALGLTKDNAVVMTAVSLIFLSALLTGLGVYDRLAKHAGAGTLVPITGFSNAIVASAMEFKSEGYILGMSAKLFTIAGPVLVFGISASVLYGIILRLLGQ